MFLTPSPCTPLDGDLPLCRFRGAAPAGQADAVWCESPALRVNGPVHPDICRGCAYPDVDAPAPRGRAPCLYRGELRRHAPRGRGPDRGQPVEVFSCGRHGECTASRVADGLTCCAACPQFRARDTSPAAADSPENSVKAMTAILRGPRRDWPEDWPWWGTTLEAHRRLAVEFARQASPYPEGRFRGRGVVILGGGPFFPGAYVTVRMLRHFGCDLPVEVWHHGKDEPVIRPWLEALNVRCVDLSAHARAQDPPPRLLGAWASKFYAVLHSAFEEVLFLDSDCYPVTDVTPLFDANPHGTVLWPDYPRAEWNIRWHIYPELPTRIPALNSGQMVLHKARCWKALTLAQWWAEHADYSFRHGVGDQDLLRGVWSWLGQPFTMFAAKATVDARENLIYPGPDGRSPALIHRLPDKVRLPCLPITRPASAGAFTYRSETITGEPTYQEGLPGEPLVFQFLGELKRRFERDPCRFRPDSGDDLIWDEVVTANAYRLPEKLPPESRVIDVGAHIGALTHFALLRGARHVWAFEPDPDNRARCAENLEIWGSRVTLREQAVWSRRGRAGFNPPPRRMTAVGRVVPAGQDVETVSLDEILEEVSDGGRGRIYLLKLDCEGSEWPILFASERLPLCEHIVGEYHCDVWEGKRRGPDDLVRVLRRHGFEVRTSPYSDALGLFWAVRAGGG